MITLHVLKQSRAYRIAWLLELLGLDYRTDIIERDAETSLAPETLRRIHPLGKSPVLEEDGLVLAESGAIVEYLVSRHGQDSGLKPPADSTAYPDYLFWLHYAEGSLMPLLVMSLVFRRIDERKMPFFARTIARKITGGVRAAFLDPQLQLHLGFVESKLADGRRWLLGDAISAADVMMSFPLQAAVLRSSLTLPHVGAYVRRIDEDPAWQRVQARIGPLTLL